MRYIFLFIALLGFITNSAAQDSIPPLPEENDYYKIVKIPTPEGIVLEVGGLAVLPDGSAAVSTRRGDVWVIENIKSHRPHYRKFASGLHEILGLAYQNGAFYCAQRGELTRLTDRNGDGIADRYETVYAWPLSGHYHEYSFGPKIMADGSFMVTANVSFGSTDWWAGKSVAPWRGWAMRISPNGTMEPFAAGLRSPCGIGAVGDMFFYGDNQGDWMGSGFVAAVQKGDFMGHPASLKWADRPESPVKARSSLIFGAVEPRDNPLVKPENIAEEPLVTLYDLAKKHPEAGIRPPAVWLPHGVLGVSTSEIIADETNGAFGPFAGQMFVGDQGMSKIARVFLEQVNGQYQGASFDFRSGFSSGVLRMDWTGEGQLLVGGTNRGWGSVGKEPFALERLFWTGQTPFEMKAVRAMPDGFEIEFTLPVQPALANNPENFALNSYIYKYHPVYGSPMTDYKEHAVRGVKVSDDGLRVRIVADSLREGYIHVLTADGVRSAKEGLPLLHPAAYYTLNAIPSGQKADIPLTNKVKIQPQKEQKTTDPGMVVNTPDNQMKEARPGGPVTTATVKEKTKAAAPTINQAEIKALLTKHTCASCHKTNERAVGPAFTEIAKRKYSNQKIVSLIQSPKPENWPDYTPMAPMSHVPKKDLEKIAVWINSLKK